VGAEDDLIEVEFDPDQRILAAVAARLRPAARPAAPEEGLEDVAEVAEVAGIEPASAS